MRKEILREVDGSLLGVDASFLKVDATWCDLVIASENAVLGQTGARVGACPTVGATQYLPRIVGERIAREMIFLCRTFK